MINLHDIKFPNKWTERIANLKKLSDSIYMYSVGTANTTVSTGNYNINTNINTYVLDEVVEWPANTNLRIEEEI